MSRTLRAAKSGDGHFCHLVCRFFPHMTHIFAVGFSKVKCLLQGVGISIEAHSSECTLEYDQSLQV